MSGVEVAEPTHSPTGAPTSRERGAESPMLSGKPYL